jgi:hypothetical protein
VAAKCDAIVKEHYELQVFQYKMPREHMRAAENITS